jgi:hypothetical protein
LLIHLTGSDLSFLKKTEIYPVFISSKRLYPQTKGLEFGEDVVGMHVFNVNFKGETELPIKNSYNYQFFNFKINIYNTAGRTK